MNSQREYRPGDRGLYAADYNALVEEVQRLGRIFGDGIDVENSTAGIILRPSQGRGSKFARIIGTAALQSGGSGSGVGLEDCIGVVAYTWQEVRPLPCGEWETVPNGITATSTSNPLFEDNGNDIPVGKVVQIWFRVARLTTLGVVTVEWRTSYGVGLPSGTQSGSGAGSGDDCVITDTFRAMGADCVPTEITFPSAVCVRAL